MMMTYNKIPITSSFGVFIRGINLNDVIDNDEFKKKIINDLKDHRLLIFKDQGKLSADTQLSISRIFGNIESTFSKHPKSPHPDIFRVSNDSNEGCTNVGRSGWHIDGTFLQQPFKVQTMHFWSISKHGYTHFVPLKETVENLSIKEKEYWDKLYFVSNHSIIHPLIYNHPVTNDYTMCFHCGIPFVETFLENYNSEKQSMDKMFSWKETTNLLNEITIKMENSSFKYTHKWEDGDFAIIDNLALAHYADPGTQLPCEKDGLRILHRTTVSGDYGPPIKN